MSEADRRCDTVALDEARRIIPWRSCLWSFNYTKGCRVSLRVVLTMLISLPPEHRRNFRRLREAARLLQPTTGSETSDARRSHGYCLLRFYALESGLKYLLNDREKVPHKHEIAGNASDEPESVEGFGHDLLKMARRLKVPAMHAPKLNNSFRLSGGYKPNGFQQSFPISDTHQAWRYGLVIDAEDQSMLEVCVEALIRWVGDQLEGA
jgi:hypothetical protein